MSADEIKRLASNEVQEFLSLHEKDDEQQLLLKHKTILGIPAALIAQQLAGRRRAKDKLPLFYATKGIVYPPSLNLEQSSSDVTARFKTEVIGREIVSKAIKGADLTGGFGIDSFFLSKAVGSIDFVEPNQELLYLARHNHHLLGINIQYYNQTAEEFLATTSSHDLIYIDPSRRDSKARKVSSLKDCSPNVTSLLPDLFDKADFILIKASPLLDLKQGILELSGVKKVFVVSVENDCKELLFFLQKGFASRPSIETYNLDAEGKIKHSFHFTFEQEEEAISEFSPPQEYLYEPNASVLKAGAFKLVGGHFGLKKLHVNTHFYTSEVFQNNFPGRVFKIESDFDVANLPDRKANIITRNYPLSPDELKKKFKLKDGGENFVIGLSGQKKKHLLVAKRLA
ncbi:hypothetical protein WSM22_15090 [Cytophagales bacterium WSM2-2]|nr:hypothetical protein WSM22_15090 [Cytophagales bacterium WSM2-2]